jgi:gas vesicle protein
MGKKEQAPRKKGSAKSFVKGLAAGAVLGAVAALVHNMDNKHEKAEVMQKAAERIKNKVAKRAKEMGKLTKSAYNNIVDATIVEFKELKDVSSEEMDELQGELKASWSEVEGVLKKKSPAVPAGTKAKKAPAKKKH